MTPTVPERSSGSSAASLTRRTRGQPEARATFSRARVLEELTEPMTTTASAPAGDGLQRRLAVGGGETEVRAVGHPQIGEPLPGPGHDAGPFVVAQRGLGQQRHRGAGASRRGVVDVGLGPHQSDRVGGDRHGADGLFVAFVADVEHGVALAGPHLQLVVDLGDEGADGVHHDPARARGPRSRPRAPSRGPRA